MAEQLQFICKGCGHTLQAWSDGNPYYIDGKGKKQYAYHPDHEAPEKCIGNDSPYICLACGDEFKVDSEKPITQCPTCNAEDIVDKFKLEGKTCHACKTDVFGIDPNFFCVS
ncbi:MAG: hypothetical protein HOH77_19305 [Candidatus Latescibacteria bacterium]|jgi:hypothetical protein|nr:hypothetical protein [Candidatus Latescibacterota bacterium]